MRKKIFVVAFVFMVSLCMFESANAMATYWSGNGHWYELITSSQGIDWESADSAATTSGGYLVTITSAEENLFLTNYLGDYLNGNDYLHYCWTGGYQLDGSTEPGDGWTWANGEAFSYENWADGGEPNDTGGVENRVIFDHGIGADGKDWNDIAASTSAAGYVVEYDNNPNPVPEPTTFLFFGIGITGLVGVRILKKKN